MTGFTDCSACRFFDPFDEPKAGFCRRYAPFVQVTPQAIRDAYARSFVWPTVIATDWCGEHQPRAGRI